MTSLPGDADPSSLVLHCSQRLCCSLDPGLRSSVAHATLTDGFGLPVRAENCNCLLVLRPLLALQLNHHVARLLQAQYSRSERTADVQAYFWEQFDEMPPAAVPGKNTLPQSR